MTLTELRAFVARNYPVLRVRWDGEIYWGADMICAVHLGSSEETVKAAIDGGLSGLSAAYRKKADLLAGMVRQ